jgi:DNA-binding transcriptional ArsR family regulator
MRRRSDRQLDRTLAALADPTRRAILANLRGGRMRVTEVARPFPVSLNAISKHIQVLEKAGLVKREVCGREHFLTIDTRPLDAADSWITETKQFWNDRLRGLERALRNRGS